MKSFNPSFEDRAGQAAEAKKKALEKLRQKPPVDEAVAAERLAAQQRRDAIEAEKRAAKKQAEQDVKDAKAAEAAKLAAVPPPPTEAEKKAARDAKYAARKKRK
jgi:ATPase subunit of ABC transporter with duplicated ATPase domains